MLCFHGKYAIFLFSLRPPLRVFFFLSCHPQLLPLILAFNSILPLAYCVCFYL